MCFSGELSLLSALLEEERKKKSKGGSLSAQQEHRRHVRDKKNKTTKITRGCSVAAQAGFSSECGARQQAERCHR